MKIGPTWQYDNGWLLPAVTLGWRNIAWAGLHLSAPKGGPWVYTLEQARFILWHDALDPETGDLVCLFDPRRQVWAEHFAWSDDGTHIVGRTACGRATVRALHLNRPVLVAARHVWVAVGWHPPRD